MNCRIYAVLCVTLSCAAQSPDARPRFEVVSVKRNPSGCEHGRGGSGTPPPGRLRVSCIALKDLIQAAYGTFANGPTPAPFVPDVIGAPDWVDTDLYDLDALPAGPATIDRMYGPMMQTLLEERFGLRIRHEARQRSVYLLTVDPGGPKLNRTPPGSCVVFDPAHPPEQPRNGQPPPAVCGRGSYRRDGVSLSVDAHGVTMAQFAGGTLGHAELGRPVIDRTGLAGQFDIHFEFRSDLATPLDGSEAQDSPGSIFSAMRELGLKLAAGKAPVDVLVVERINRPTENLKATTGLHLASAAFNDGPNDDVGRVRRDAIAIGDLLRVGNNLVAEWKRLQEVAELLRCVQRKREEDDVLVLVDELVQSRDLLPARRAADEPEIQGDRLPREFERPVLAVERNHVERERPFRSGGAPAGYF
jgi:uncharacterized protein (TIGR03435 family)